jgi:glutamine---fructose-6-phosphate transaminase (isomerizing)
VVYLNDGEIVAIRRTGYEVKTIDNELLDKEIHELEWDLEEIEKGGYEHFMLKEIMEQPDSLENCMRGRLHRDDSNSIKLGGLIDVIDDDSRLPRRIIIAACGTSWHAGLVG